VAGLRERKKAQTHAAIAAAAADLFARDGYPNVTMTEVAARAGVSDQTLYNYFPTKESLVFDRIDQFERYLIGGVVDRPAGTDLLDAFHAWLDAFVLGDSAIRAVANPGGMVRLVASSDALRRMLLDLTHTIATRLAVRLRESEALAEPVATALADAMLAITVRITQEVGAARGPADLPAITDRARRAVDAIRPLIPH
jgi:AcrR family transcriptional regulator